MKDIFGRPIEPGAVVAVSRQVGYSVSQYAATVIDAYRDKSGVSKVKVQYDPARWGVPKTAQNVGADKVVVIHGPRAH